MKKYQDLISVIVPVYNAQKYLEECIESILNQTYQNYEVWLLDDHSTDDSRKICESYRDRDMRFHVLTAHNPEHLGCGALRDLGIQCATGDYTIFIDSDDTFEPHALERLLTAVKEEQSDIAVGNFTKYLEADQTFLFHVHEPDYFVKTYSPREWFQEGQKPEFYALNCFTVAWGKLIRTSLLRKVSYRSDVSSEDDYTQYKLYLLADRITFVNEPLYLYRVLENSNFSTAKRSTKYPREAREERIALLTAIGFDTSNELEMYKYRIRMQRDAYLDEHKPVEYRNACAMLEILEKYHAL